MSSEKLQSQGRAQCFFMKIMFSGASVPVLAAQHVSRSLSASLSLHQSVHLSDSLTAVPLNASNVKHSVIS